MVLYVIIYPANTLIKAVRGFLQALQANAVTEIRQLPLLPPFFQEKLFTSISVIQLCSLSDIQCG
jgi:hypothetical protein